MKEELGFWAAVGLVAVVAVVVFKLVAGRLGDKVPALGQLADFI
jgi:hypothetical protein